MFCSFFYFCFVSLCSKNIFFSLSAIKIIQLYSFSFFILLFKGDDAMFGDAEHYKYLTNEADLNNVADDSIALTPKTPKKVLFLCLHLI
jgi:hypothetical protein